MIKEHLGFIIFVLFLSLVVIVLLRQSKSAKYNERISKYTVNNERSKKISLGDYISLMYHRFRKMIVKSLKGSIYFKRRMVRYERFAFLDSPINIIATKFCLSILFGLLYTISAIYKNNFDIMVLLLMMVVGYFVYNIYLLYSENKRNKLIENDLLKAIIIMNNAFKSGYNITQAIMFVSKDLTGPISAEFEKIGNDLNYGLEIKDVFDRFYERVHLDDVKYITSSLSLLNLTGGNLVGVFNNIEKSFTNKKRLKDELNAMTSSSRLVFYILLVMPVVIISILLVLSPTYFSPLFKNPLGILLCFVALILYIVYVIIIRKILKVDA